MLQQLNNLQQSLARISGVSISALEDLWTRQRRRAQELCDAQVPRTRVVDVEQQYSEPYTVPEGYQEQEPYTDQETYQTPETYTETEMHTVTVQEQRQKWDGDLGRMLGWKKSYTVDVQKQVPVQVQKVRMVPATRTVTKYREVQRTRNVTKYRTATRTLQQTVEYKLPVEDFHHQALEQIIAEIRSTFTSQGF